MPTEGWELLEAQKRMKVREIEREIELNAERHMKMDNGILCINLLFDYTNVHAVLCVKMGCTIDGNTQKPCNT